jgi:hypothetical protein
MSGTLTNTMMTVNERLDAICLGADDNAPQNLVSLATESVERVKSALVSCGPIERHALAPLLSDAAWQLNQTGVNLDKLVWALGGSRSA